MRTLYEPENEEDSDTLVERHELISSALKKGPQMVDDDLRPIHT